MKHKKLTADEVNSYDLDFRIKELSDKLKEKHSDVSKIKVLDWGCGRGRAVLKLLEQGFDVYGVDIDDQVLKNGYDLFRSKGYAPEKHLLHFSALETLKKSRFDFIFSEQVFEHIKNLEENIQIQAKLTRAGGIGCHVFPSSKMITECHINMPFVHWLPKNSIRKYWIAAMIMLSKKPDIPWPEADDKSFWEEVNVYYRYLDEKTYYRSNYSVKQIFEKHGFEADFEIKGIHTAKRRLLPDFLKLNGFPDQQVRFIVKKK